MESSWVYSNGRRIRKPPASTILLFSSYRGANDDPRVSVGVAATHHGINLISVQISDNTATMVIGVSRFKRSRTYEILH